jgi:hypothetical protein
MDDANLSRRQTVRVEPGVAYAQAGVVAFDGPIDLQALRLYGLPEAAPAVLNGTPLLSGPLSGSGGASSRQKCRGDLPSLAAGATALLDVSARTPASHSGRLGHGRPASPGPVWACRRRCLFSRPERRPLDGRSGLFEAAWCAPLTSR